VAAWGYRDVFGGLFWDLDGGYGAGISVCVVDGWESDVCREYVVLLGDEFVEGQAGGGRVKWGRGGDVCCCVEV
jgi:hypothetical protein